MSLAEVTQLRDVTLLDIRKQLAQLADECDDAEVDAVVTVCIVKGRVQVRGFGAGCDSERTYLLLGLGKRELENQWVEAAEAVARGE